MWGLIAKGLGKGFKGLATGDAQAQLGMQSPHLAGGVTRIGRFLFTVSGLWVSTALYSGYVNMRTPPGSGPTLVMPGKKVIGSPDRPDRTAGSWFPTSTDAAKAANPGFKGTTGQSVQGGKSAYPGPIYRTDRGVDFTTPGPVYALADGKVINVGIWNGWPGTDGIVYHTKLGNIYVEEHFKRAINPATGKMFQVGDTVTKGMLLGHALKGYPWIETGYANDAGTTARDPGNSHSNSNTPGGLLFRKLLGYN